MNFFVRSATICIPVYDTASDESAWHRTFATVFSHYETGDLAPFDLGVKGDYENLYKWLDAREARECGDSVAYLNFEYSKDIVTEITTSLHSSVRMSFALADDESTDGSLVPCFHFGD